MCLSFNIRLETRGYLYLDLAGGAQTRGAVVGGRHSEGVFCSLDPPEGGGGSQLASGRVQRETLGSGALRGRSKHGGQSHS